MLVPVCDGSISTSLGSVVCNGTWVSRDLTELMGVWAGSPTIDQFEALFAALLGVFVLTYLFNFIIKFILNSR